MPEDEIKLNYQRYLKDLLLKNVPNVKFDENKNPSKAEQVCSEITQGQAIDLALNISKVITGNSHFPLLKNQNLLSTLVK